MKLSKLIRMICVICIVTLLGLGVAIVGVINSIDKVNTCFGELGYLQLGIAIRDLDEYLPEEVLTSTNHNVQYEEFIEVGLSGDEVTIDKYLETITKNVVFETTFLILSNVFIIIIYIVIIMQYIKFEMTGKIIGNPKFKEKQKEQNFEQVVDENKLK